MNALTPLGMVSDFPSENQTNETDRVVNGRPGIDCGTSDRNASDVSVATTCVEEDVEDRADYFVARDGMLFAGTHLLADLWDARRLDDPGHIDAALREAALAAGATILHSHFHHFTPNGGVSGVVVLAESHISIHTWPERDFAAVDIFMCGACDPNRSIPVLQAAFAPSRIDLEEKRRGRVA